MGAASINVNPYRLYAPQPLSPIFKRAPHHLPKMQCPIYRQTPNDRVQTIRTRQYISWPTERAYRNPNGQQWR
ncbi:Protein of unknown function [Cotesia congregata]|uniref:Uncharacterized protein n=1 Tax=Cotesia congregata TaxID=51543 RepID=A0A8J2EH79_COTCN|nr:Protein of unknown function [Cotesia congregata]